MAGCPQCQCWLSQMSSNPEWERCSQGHHYRVGKVKVETLDTGTPFRERKPKLPEDHVFDERTMRYIYRPNWNK